MKKKLLRFLKNEDGMEFMQVAVIVVGVIAIATLVLSLYTAVGNKVQEAETQLGSLLQP